MSFCNESEAQDIHYVFTGTQANDLLGRAASTGDIDGDGIVDFVLGDPGDDTNGDSAGAAQVRRGSDGSVYIQVYGDTKLDFFGQAVDVIGDANLDGFCDFAAGSRQADVPGGPPTDAGIVRTVSGLDGAIIHSIYGLTGTIGATLATGMAAAGDVNGDGRADVLASSLFDNAAYILSAFDGAVIATAYGESPTAPLFGFYGPVAALGDINGDQIPDFAAAGGGNLGFRTFSGADGKAIYTTQSSPNVKVRIVEPFPDIDGDGVQELLIGDIEDDTNGQDTGAVFVHSGANGTTVLTIHGTEPGANFGTSLSAFPDISGDSVPEILIGARYSGEPGPPGFVDGAVFIASGSDGSILRHFNGTTGECLGTAVANAGDVNLDGVPDFLASTQCASFGVTYIYSSKCGTHEVYGNGCPGSQAFTPTLTTHIPCANIGHTLALQIDQTFGGTFGVLFLGGGQGQTPVYAGCDLLLNPLLPLALPLSFSGAGAGTGSTTLFAFIPSAAAGVEVTLQAFVADPGATSGVAATNGLRIRPE